MTSPYYHAQHFEAAADHSAAEDGGLVLIEHSTDGVQWLQSNCNTHTGDVYRGIREWDGARWCVVVVTGWEGV